jgi:outer membrane murein-binding lipoprotein Lpp
MKTPAFLKRTGAGVSSAAAAAKNKISSTLAPLKAKLDRQLEKFNAFKEKHPRFKRVWNVLTHPTTTRILGIAIAVALAPLTSGFSLSFAVSLSLSCAVAFSSTLFMALQKYRLGKARGRLEVVKGISAAKSKISEISGKHRELNEQLQDLVKDERPELAQLLKTKTSEVQQKTAKRILPLTVAESLYYEGIMCFTVMTACFGIGGAVGFAASIASGLSGFVGQTKTRLGITKELYSTQDERRHEREKEGLESLSAKQEKQMLMQSRALEAALKDVEANPKLPLAKAYDDQLKAQQANPPAPSASGYMSCLADELNPFKEEFIKQVPETASDDRLSDKKPKSSKPLKPVQTPAVEAAKSAKLAPRHE